MRRALVRAPALSLTRLTAGLAVAVAAVPVAVYLWLAGHRIGYPYELDWLEGGTVELVGRALHGHSLYSAPSLSYVGFTYTPLYSYLSAGVAALTGLGFLPLRIVSLAASLVAIATLVAYVHGATRDWAAGAVAGGVFAATYGLTGWFFDVGRLDSLFLALALLALWWGRSGTGAAAGVGIGLVGFLAFFTKQVGLIAVGPALVCAAVARPRAGVAAVLTLVALAGGSTLVLDAATHGWYRYYILSELAGQPVVHRVYLNFWRADLYGHLKLLSALGLLGLLAAVLPRGIQPLHRPRVGRPIPELLLGLVRSPWLYDLAAAGGLLVAAYVSRLHSGGYLNVLMPAYAACAGIGGVAFAALRRHGWLVGLLATALLAIQFSHLIRHPGRAVPAARERQAGAALITALRRLPGPVLVLRHPWYGTLAGKGTFAQSDGIAEVLRSHGPRGAADLRRALSGSLNRDHVAAVVLDGAAPSWLAPQLAADFRLVPGSLTATPLRPPADLTSAPEYLYLRRG